MSKNHDSKREGKKPATKTAKEKHEMKRAKKLANTLKDL